jgi:TRAP-type C4-dicarboxylate transport system permease small subunit
MRIPMFIPYFALTLSFIIITLVQSAMLFAMLKDFVSGDGGDKMGCAADGGADS